MIKMNWRSLLKDLPYIIRLLFIMSVPPFYSFERLERFLKRGIIKNPNRYLPRFALSQLYSDYQKPKEAIEQLNELINLGFEDDEIYYEIGRAYYGEKNYEEAIRFLRPIATYNPPMIGENFFLGMTYLEHEEYLNAIIFLQRAIGGKLRLYEKIIRSMHKAFDTAAIYEALGYCYFMERKFHEANEIYHKALALKPNSLTLRQNVTLTHIRIGQSYLDCDLDAAKMELQKALSVCPDNKEAIDIINGIEEMQELNLAIRNAEELQNRQE